MAVNAPRSTTSREDLAAAYHEFDPSAAGYIADVVMPTLSVRKRKGDYAVVPREAYLQRIDTKRSPGSETSTSQWSPESADWTLVEYAHKGFVEEVQKEDYEDRLELEEVETIRSSRIIHTDREIDTASLLFNETNFPVSGGSAKGTTVANAWNTANGAPLDDIAGGITFLEDNYGIDSPDLIINRQNHRNLSLNDQIRASILDMYGAVKPGILPLDQLATILNVGRVIVAGAGTVYNSAKPGQPAEMAKIWSDTYAMLCKIDGGRDTQLPSIGRTFKLSDRSEGLAIDSWYQEDPEGEWIRAREHAKPILSPDPAGYLLKSVG